MEIASSEESIEDEISFTKKRTDNDGSMIKLNENIKRTKTRRLTSIKIKKSRNMPKFQIFYLQKCILVYLCLMINSHNTIKMIIERKKQGMNIKKLNVKLLFNPIILPLLY